ncbi:MAG: peptidase [Magnetococcales bacterium]|nr:peptidase [Magnetococcales bacterium]
MADPTRPIRIFRAGTHTDMHGVSRTITAGDLESLATAYDPALSEAPLVIGHPTTNGPSWGWAEGFSVIGGDLYARFRQVDPQVEEMVRNGRFKHVSASFYPPDSPSNPKPGIFYPRHIGLLGAQPPAIKGLGPVSFAAGDGAVEFLKPLSDSKENPMPDKDPATAFAEPSDRKVQELQTREAQVAAREKALLDAEQAHVRRRHADFVETLVRDGRVLPADKVSLVEVLVNMEGAGTLQFAEDGRTVHVNPGKFLREFLGKMPKQIEFGEKTPPETRAPARSAHPVPPGYTVDPARLALHQQALAYAASHNVDYITAVTAVETL